MKSYLGLIFLSGAILLNGAEDLKIAMKMGDSVWKCRKRKVRSWRKQANTRSKRAVLRSWK